MSRDGWKAFLGLCALVSLASTAQASRVVLVDLPGNNYEDGGQKWNGDTQVVDSATGQVSFALNFGSGAAAQSFTFSPSGQILFSGGNFVAPFLSQTPFKASGRSGFDSSYMSWGSGLVDPTLLDDVLPNPPMGTYNPANALTAFRFTWSEVCIVCDGSDTVTFQLLLVDRKNGDFDLDFNYRDGGLPAGGSRGYSLGSNVLALTSGPFAFPGPDYCFRGGVGALCGTVAAIPEPETWAMVVGGMALLGLRARRRRAVVAPTT